MSAFLKFYIRGSIPSWVHHQGFFKVYVDNVYLLPRGDQVMKVDK